MKTHVTWLAKEGERLHYSNNWRIIPFAGTGLSLWFFLIVRWTVLESMDRGWEKSIRFPETDAQRRKDEFAGTIKQMELRKLSLPHERPQGDYIYCAFCVRTDLSSPLSFDPSIFSIDGSIDDDIDGFPAGTQFLVQPSKYRHENIEVVIGTAMPPGNLKSDVAIGFPRQRKSPQAEHTLLKPAKMKPTVSGRAARQSIVD